MRTLVAVSVVILLGCLSMVCLAAEPVKTKPSPARLKGMKAAVADLEKGTLKQKEYPPLPYSAGMIEFIKLLQSECGVEWQVLNGPVDPKEKIEDSELQAEVQGYNDVMRSEIEHRFGRDIFPKLAKKANLK